MNRVSPPHLLAAVIAAALIAAGVSWTAEAARAPDANGAPTANAVLPPSPAPAYLDAVDFVSCYGSIDNPCQKDDWLLLSSLQGVVNRTKPGGNAIYLIEPGFEDAYQWRDYLGVPWQRVANVYETSTDPGLLLKYRSMITGVYVYDPGVPDTINLAVSLAGLNGAIVVSPRLAAVLTDPNGDYKLTAKTLPDGTKSLVGKFTRKIDVYNWAYKWLWSPRSPLPRTTHAMLVALPPVDPSTGQPMGGLLHDYAVANKAIVLWLDPNVPAEASLLGTFARDVAPNTPYLGWFPPGGEQSGVYLLSQRQLLTLAADWFQNMSVLSGTANGTFSTPPPVIQRAPKIYVSFTTNDGDNLQFDQHRLRQLWDDPARGTVPITWSVSPLLRDSAPLLLNYYRSTLAPNDALIAGPSGAAYIYANAWPSKAIATFTQLTGTFMPLTGTAGTLVYDNPPNGITDIVARSYIANNAALSGLLTDWLPGYQTQARLVQNVPVVRGHLSCDDTANVADSDVTKDIAAQAATWDHTTPMFISVGIDVWCTNATPTRISQIVQYLQTNGYPDLTPVSNDALFKLIATA